MKSFTDVPLMRFGPKIFPYSSEVVVSNFVAVIKWCACMEDIGNAEFQMSAYLEVEVFYIYTVVREKKKTLCFCYIFRKQEAQLMLTTGSTRLAVSRGQQTWYHTTCNI